MQKKLLLGLHLLLLSSAAMAQKDTNEISVKTIYSRDSVTVIVDSVGNRRIEHYRRPNISTKWLSGIDFGFSNFVDHTNYDGPDVAVAAPGANEDWFDLRNSKSVNVNIWLFSQQVNLISHTVNLKYALGFELNNYRFRKTIRFAEDAPYVQLDKTEGRVYRKNKLSADYITFPIMLNFNFAQAEKGFDVLVRKTNDKMVKFKWKTPKQWGFSLGVSAGYLYSSRNKTITSDEGKEKLKDNFNLQPWKLAYVGEVNLGYISLYGSYAVKSMFKNGLDLTPYNLGLRLGL